MALIACEGCGAQISRKAKACPACAHPVRRTSTATWIVCGLLVIGVVPVLLRPASTPDHLTPPDPPAPTKPAPTAVENRATAERLLAAIGAKTLINASKDPESFELKSAAVHTDGTICYDYRAKNSFNAMLAGSAVLTPKGKMLIHEHDGNTFVREWNKGCTKGDGHELVDVVKIMVASPQ